MDHDHDNKDVANFDFALIYCYYICCNRYQHRGWLLSGQAYVNNLLNCSHDKYIISALRITLPTFYKLRDWLQQNIQLKSSRISIEEKLVIFLYIAGTSIGNTTAQERFSCSRYTISK
jgi:hypothetical protein